MSDSLYKVLIVDDDRFAQKLIVRSLQGAYQLKIADDGLQGLLVAQEWLPDAILLDVEMPIKNGYETCEALKNDPTTVDIPVLFLSGKDSQREKLLGFELGAEDYLVKPFEPEILKAKVNRAVVQYVLRRNLSNIANVAQETAFEAMTASSELGRALRFTEHAYAISSFDDLACALFQSLKEFGLKTSVMFLSNSGALFYSHNSLDISPLEKDLLQINHENGNRFMDFGNRTFCNFRQTCLLIKNMPLDDPERYGRIKDFVPFILGAIDGKIRALDIHNKLMQQSENLGRSVDIIGQTLKSLTHEVSSSHATIADIMKNLLFELDERLPKLGLEEDQEKYLVGRIDRAFTNALSALDKNLVIGESLSDVVHLLEHLHTEQETMVKNATVVPIINTSNGSTEGDTLAGDVVLF